MFALLRQRDGLFVRAPGLRRPIADSQRDGDVGAPAAGVGRVALPHGGLVGGAMDLHNRDGLFRLPVLVGPLHGESGDRGVGAEQVRIAVGHEVGHLAAVGHAGHEHVVPADAVVPLQVPDEGLHEAHVVPFQSLLDIVSDIPAGLSFRILLALRVTYGKALPFSDFQHGRAVSFGFPAISVQHQHERCRGIGALGDVQPVCPCFTLVLHGVRHCLRRHGQQPQREKEADKNGFASHLSIVLSIVYAKFPGENVPGNFR